jgi:hypothetical protein
MSHRNSQGWRDAQCQPPPLLFGARALGAPVHLPTRLPCRGAGGRVAGPAPSPRPVCVEGGIAARPRVRGVPRDRDHGATSRLAQHGGAVEGQRGGAGLGVR